MGNTNISPTLKKKIKEFLNEQENKLLIPNETAFLNRAGMELLRKLKRNNKNN